MIIDVFDITPHFQTHYCDGVATVSRIDEIIGLLCRIACLL